MKIRKTLMALLMLPLLYACQSENYQGADQSKRVITVRASLPEAGATRSYVTYGNTDVDKEIFRWHPVIAGSSDNDYITVFNVTRLSEYPNGAVMAAVRVEGNTAVFETIDEVKSKPLESWEEPVDFEVKEGDLIFVSYWDAGRKELSDGGDIFTIDLATKPQPIVENPDDTATLYMQGNLKMYDIVTAVKDNEIPDVHFKHLSAIMRVTLRNETGADLIPKVLEFKYPGTASFFVNSICCSVDTESSDGSGLKVYNSEEEYSDSVSAHVNNYTAALTAVGEPIKNGKTYDLYLSCVPRIANKQKGKELIIRLAHRLGSGEFGWHEMTLDGFDVPIEAGKRYWFNLTAVKEGDERKLMLTSDWEEKQKQEGTPGENTQETD